MSLALESDNNPELIYSNENHVNRVIVSNFESLPVNVKEQWLDVRRDFMDSNMDWHVESDYDNYDADPSTMHVILQDEYGHIKAGMRLTPKKSIKESLSLGMVPSVDISKVEELEGPVWDITRLVPGKNISGRRKKMALFTELIGVAFANNLYVDSNPRWVFASYKSFINVFKHYGIEFTQIENVDDSSTVLCYADPVERLNFLVENKDKFQDAYLSAMKGISLGDS